MSLFDGPMDAADTVQLATFGQQVSYERAFDAVVTTPTGIVSSGGAFETAHSGVKASIFFKLSDFSVDPVKGDKITFNSKIYSVAEDPRDGRDGLGGITLLLRYVQDVEAE